MAGTFIEGWGKRSIVLKGIGKVIGSWKYDEEPCIFSKFM